ncbi:uncharacterized protein LOC124155290 [Ischnura elegans]|uniref:uncharacterized protein LOC124155290 n=1 Tax=Ischnura elegans TaxID=197161 RepID=UPI001ED87D47|nr:uncharacterized protein LOC124155290 [Ischnura elegans]
MAGRVSIGGKEMDLQQALEQMHNKLRELSEENEKLRADNGAAAADRGPTKNFGVLGSVEGFSGKPGESVTLFFDKLERAAELGGLSDSEKLHVAVLRLSGEAAEYFRSREECIHAANYEELKELLLQRYRSKRSARFYREMLINIRMSPGEDIETFADRIRKINSQTYEIDGAAEHVAATRFEADQRALDTFLRGLPGELGRQCRLTAPKIFDEAVQAAMRIQEVEGCFKERPQPTRHIFRAPREMACFNCGEEGHFARECKTRRRCHSCGREGHVARECRNRRRGEGNGNLNAAGADVAANRGPW